MTTAMGDRLGHKLPEGLSARPAREDEFPALYELLAEYENDIAGWVESSYEDLRSYTRVGNFSFEKDSFTVWDGAALVGWGLIWNGDVASAPSDSFGVTHPAHRGRGIGSYLVHRLETRHAELYRAGTGRDPALRLHTEATDQPARELVESRGFTLVRRHYTMEIELGSVPEPEGSSSLVVSACREEDLPLFHQVVEESFAEHWGNTPETYGDFLRSTFDRPDTRLDLWLIAWDGDTPAAVMLGRVKDGIGWIDVLGVLKSYRRRGTGEMLLRNALWRFQEEGLAKARLGVDASNASGAVALYERAGMRSVRVFVSYQKAVV